MKKEDSKGRRSEERKEKFRDFNRRKRVLVSKRSNK